MAQQLLFAHTEAGDLTKFIDSIDKKLANKGFVDKAPAEVVKQQRDKLAELRETQADDLDPGARALARLLHVGTSRCR